ncbi:MAG: hypothetical protein Q9N67_10505 [Ghiorsea sp.]|nr:hypothetical protein [Ghiorsea sp.]
MKHACEKISHLASEQLDRKLSMSERFSMLLHFLMCAACRHHSQNILKLHRALLLQRQQNTDDLQLPDEKRKNIQESLQKHIK